MASATDGTATPGHGRDPLPHTSSRYGQHKNLVFTEVEEEETPRRLRDLFHRPVIRQWVEDGKLYREPSPREVPRIELFWDLLFVGVIRQLSEVAIEHPGGLAVARFILTFYPSWSVWEEARRFSNVSGTDDILHRFWVLVGMMCILGYSVNASGILIPGQHAEGCEAAAEGASEGATAVEEAVHAARHFLARAGEAVTEGAAEAAEGAESHFTAAQCDSRTVTNTAIHAATAFWLIIKITRVFALWVYAYKLKEFRKAQFLGGCAVLVPMFVYLPLIWVKSPQAQIALATIGICLDLCRVDAIMYYLGSRYMKAKREKEARKLIEAGKGNREDVPNVSLFSLGDLPTGLRIPAINIEHAIDRAGAFVVIVLGEMVMNSLYIAGPTSFGASAKYGKAALGLMVAWGLNYLYTIPTDEWLDYKHALRRSWFAGMMFTFLHWPLCASLVLASAACAKMIANDTVEAGVKWYWGCGLGFAMLCIVLIDLLHKDMRGWRGSRIPRIFRFSFALAGALALILFPLSSHRLSSTAMMAIAVGIIWTVLGVYAIGVLPSNLVPRDHELEAIPPPEVTDLHAQREQDREEAQHNRHELERAESLRSHRTQRSRKSHRARGEEHIVVDGSAGLATNT